MRKIVLMTLVAASLLLVAFGAYLLLQPSEAASAGALPSAPPGQVARITVEDLHARLQRDVPPLVWELRPLDSYLQQHIAGSKQVELGEIEAAVAGVAPGQAIVTLCA